MKPSFNKKSRRILLQNKNWTQHEGQVQTEHVSGVVLRICVHYLPRVLHMEQLDKSFDLWQHWQYTPWAKKDELPRSLGRRLSKWIGLQFTGTKTSHISQASIPISIPPEHPEHYTLLPKPFHISRLKWCQTGCPVSDHCTWNPSFSWKETMVQWHHGPQVELAARNCPAGLVDELKISTRIASTTLKHDQQPWKLRDAQASRLKWGLQCQSCEVHSDKSRETYPPVDTRTVRDRSFPEKWNSRSGHSEHVQFQNTTDCHKLPDSKCESWIWMGSISYCSLPLYLAGCWDQRLVTLWPFWPLTVYFLHIGPLLWLWLDSPNTSTC